MCHLLPFVLEALKQTQGRLNPWWYYKIILNKLQLTTRNFFSINFFRTQVDTNTVTFTITCTAIKLHTKCKHKLLENLLENFNTKLEAFMAVTQKLVLYNSYTTNHGVLQNFVTQSPHTKIF